MNPNPSDSLTRSEILEIFHVKIDDSQIHAGDATFVLADIKIVELVDERDPGLVNWGRALAVGIICGAVAFYQFSQSERLYWVVSVVSTCLFYLLHICSFSVFVSTSVGRKRIIRFRYFDPLIDCVDCKSYMRAYKRAGAIKDAISDAIAGKHTPKSSDDTQAPFNKPTQL